MLGYFVVIHIGLAMLFTLSLLASRGWIFNAVGWITAIWFVPFFGSIAYAFLNASPGFFVNRKIKHANAVSCLVKQEDSVFPEKWQSSIQLGCNLGLSSFSSDYQAEIFENADCIPDMLQAIDNAKSEILLCTYIFSGKIAEDFIDALEKAQKRGVSVYLLIDTIGSQTWRPDSQIERHLEKSGIKYVKFLINTLLLSMVPSLNVRSHVKILCVDDKVAFVGSMNIRDEVIEGISSAKDYARNMNVKMTGEVARDVSAFFCHLWHIMTKEAINRHQYLEDSNKDNASDGRFCRATFRGAYHYYNGILYAAIFALHQARKRVTIWMPYFFPPRPIRDALLVTAMRGVKVELLIPTKTDSHFVDVAMSADFEKYLARGIEIFMSPEPFDHSKIMIIDDDWCMIGSANFDNRSFYVNFECNLEFIDKDFVSRANKIFLERKKLAKKLDQGFRLPILRQIYANFIKLLSPQL
jgi:cardiolipin synthase